MNFASLDFYVLIWFPYLTSFSTRQRSRNLPACLSCFARSPCSVAQTSRSHSCFTTFCVPCGSACVRSPQRSIHSLPSFTHARVLCHVACPSYLVCAPVGLRAPTSPPQQLAYSATQVPFVTTSATLRQFSSARPSRILPEPSPFGSLTRVFVPSLPRAQLILRLLTYARRYLKRLPLSTHASPRSVSFFPRNLYSPLVS